ncbi:aldehyde dehydrogenase family protein, partial [Mycolicibacterium pulveris]
WSADPLRAAAVARRLRTGMVVINGGGGGLNPAAPFGGYKHSGIGREFGQFGLAEYLQHKALQWPVG